MKTMLVYVVMLAATLAVFGIVHGSGGGAAVSAASAAGLGAVAFVAGIVFYVKMINRGEENTSLVSAALAAAAGSLAFAVVIPVGTAAVPIQFVNTASGLLVVAPLAAIAFGGAGWDRLKGFVLSVLEVVFIWLAFWLMSGQPKLTLPPWLPL